MSRMVLATGGQIAGAALGSIIPGVGTAIGAAIGGAIGGVAGALLFPPPPTYGPQLEDASVAPGSYGSPIGILYGLGEFHADMIWVRGNKRDVVEKESGGGKGGGPTHTTFHYFATFAVLICDAEIAGVRRIHAGRELIYDGTSEELEAAIAAGSTLPLTGPAEGVTVRIYTGTADQEPDPSIQAEDEHAPAWRGFAYLVFEDLALEKFGNEIPPMFVEAVQAGTGANPVTSLGEWDSGNTMFDPARERLAHGGGGTGSAGISVRIWDLLTGQLERHDTWANSDIPNAWLSSTYGDLDRQVGAHPEADWTQTFNAAPVAWAPDGSFYVIVGEVDVNLASAMKVGFGLVIDAETGTWLGTLSTDLNLDENQSFGFSGEPVSPVVNPMDHRLREVEWLTPDPLTGVQPWLYLHAQYPSTIYFGAVSAEDRGKIPCDGAVHFSDVSFGVVTYCGADVNAAGDKLFAVYRDSNDDWKVARSPLAGFRAGDDWNADLYTADVSVVVGTSLGVARDCVYNRDADKFCVVFNSGLVVFDTDLNEVGRITTSDIRLNFGDSTAQRGPAGDIDGRLWFSSHNNSDGSETQPKDKFVAISTATAEVLETKDITDWGKDDGPQWRPIWQMRGETLVTRNDENSPRLPYLFFGDRISADKIPLADVLEDAAVRAGMETADLDLSAVSRLIYGAPQKKENVTPRGIWEDLLLHTGHDAMMVDGLLTVRPRATSVTGTIDDDDLGADGGPAYTRRTNPSQVLRRAEVKYRSVPAQLDRAQQADEFPREVAPHGEVARMQTSLVMDDDEAWEDVQRLLATGSSERTEIEAAVPYTRGDIEPGQIWTLSADGRAADMRVGEIEGGIVLGLKGTAAWPFLAPAGTPVDSSRPAPTLDEIPATDYALVDAHIWRDTDDSGAFTVAGWPRRNKAAWNGGVIFHGASAMAIDDELAVLATAARVGTATAKLGDVPSANHWDRGNTLTVRMLSGTPESATEAEVLAGANPVWVACGSTGEWELVQYATATDNGDGSWRLSNLLRGRRGTEHLTGDHAHGDRVLWASTTTARRVGGAHIGTERYYISASIGDQQDSTTRRAFTNRARGLRPYSVVQVEGSRDGSDNLTITWVRRSRLVGDVTRTDRPLGEASEAYEVDIMDGDTVVRTIDGLSSPSASYSAADQTTDFGSAQAAVDVRIYQISDTFGRGVVREATV